MKNKKEYNVFGIKPSTLKEVEPWLNEYFGISYGYFEEEISQIAGYLHIKTEVGESRTLKALQLDEHIPFSVSFDFEELTDLWNFEEDDDSDQSIIDALFLLAYIIKEKSFSWIDDNPDITDYVEYNIVRQDLLKLYIFTNQRKSDKLQGQKLSLKHQLGSVEITNYGNWFTRRLLKDYLAVYLADIESIEQAEDALLKYKKPAGRKIKDNRIHIILYGIFRMFNGQKNMKSPQSDALCEFIQSYLQFVGLTDDDTNIDNQWIRAQITYLKTKAQPPRFEHIGISTKTTLDDLKKSGNRLH